MKTPIVIARTKIKELMNSYNSSGNEMSFRDFKTELLGILNEETINEKKVIKFAFVAGFTHPSEILSGNSAETYYKKTFNQ